MNKLKSLYTDKQIEILKQTQKQDWFMLINHGAKRTGKTILNNDLFLRELMRVRKIADEEGIETPQYILAGATLGTIQKNVLIELTNKYGIEFNFDKYNSFMLFGVQVVQTGHSKVSGIGAIRGMTSFGAYINEASLAHEEVFDEIKSRCSGTGARILVDTNPDHPEHWLLKDYIENTDPKAGILSHQFKLDDNNFLNDRYKESIKASTPSGMFYERNINGMWVSGDGVVYADFDLNENTIKADEL
ncbi:TPA: phage terminase large subunit, partial [Staphylococcus aureus]|nr:phage terminase large subunit [Staphylococcus aureus]HCT9731960.1 phage terminase large subunit [Staphylococcus aureus]